MNALVGFGIGLIILGILAVLFDIPNATMFYLVLLFGIALVCVGLAVLSGSRRI